ncbi:MAG: CD1871A family CXXC motif-containing protein [Dehalobacterium sp.]
MNKKIHRINLIPTIRLLFIAGGITFILVGIYRGEAGVILQKAIHVCLECIGIG